MFVEECLSACFGQFNSCTKGNFTMYSNDMSNWLWFFLIFWVICGLLAGYLYRQRGRSELVGFWGGFLLGPLGIILALVTPADRVALVRKEKELETEKLRRGELKKCPHCGELIRPEAKVCRFCGREITPPNTTSTVDADTVKTVIIAPVVEDELKETKMKLSGFHIAVIVMTMLIGCGLVLTVAATGYMWYISQQQPTLTQQPTKPKPPTETPTPACPPKEVQAFVKEITPLLGRFVDAVKVADSTARISLVPIITQMQEIRREAQSKQPPPCAAPAYNDILQGMDLYIEAFLSFSAQGRGAEVTMAFAQAEATFITGVDQMTALAEGRPTPLPHVPSISP
jgi:uncharacterized protein (DUF983 family)